MRNLVQFFARDFQMLKKGYPQTQKVLSLPPNVPMTPFHNKKIITFIIILKATHKFENIPTILTIILKSINSHKNHHTNPPNKHLYYENKYFCSH